MNGIGGRTPALIAAIWLIAVAAAGCGHHNPLGPPVPEGATMINGPTSPAPPPPPGWTQHPVIPTSQQQAQDTILDYLKKTLDALPAGTTLDATRYGSGTTTTAGCDDNDNRPTAPKNLDTWGDLTLPPGTTTSNIVAQAGEIWKSWGWYVIERDGFYKPNRFGYAPDGYSLQIEARYRPDSPPSLSGISPCFPGDIPKERTPFPKVLTAD